MPSGDDLGGPGAPHRSPHPATPFALFVEAVTDYGIFSINTEGCITDWNTGAERMFGWREEEILGQHYRVIFTPEDRAAGVPEQEMATARAEGRANDTRWHQRKDGSRFWVEGMNHAVRDDAATLVGFAKVCRDMTERRKAEEALRAAHQRNEEVLESITDAFYAVDRDFRITYVNRRCEELWSRKREALLGQRFWQVFPQAVGSFSYEQHIKAMAERQPQHYETVSPIFGKWVEASIYPMADGGLSTYFRDITERKEVVERLRQQAELLELAHDAILVLDLNNTIRYWNRSAERLYGWTREEAQGQQAHRLLHTRFPVSFKAARNATVQTGIWEGELIHTTQDGRERIVSSRWALQRDNQGQPLAILEINRDITAQKQAEGLLRASEERLRATFEQAAVGMAHVGLDGRWLRVNQRLCEKVGYTREELLNRTFQDITYPDDLNTDLDNVRQLVAGDIATYEMEKR
jgi:PAS domain S-box-containing protein